MLLPILFLLLGLSLQVLGLVIFQANFIILILLVLGGAALIVVSSILLGEKGRNRSNERLIMKMIKDQGLDIFLDQKKSKKGQRLAELLEFLSSFNKDLYTAAVKNQHIGRNLVAKGDVSLKEVHSIRKLIENTQKSMDILNTAVDHNTESMKVIKSNIENLTQLSDEQVNQISTATSAVEEISSSVKNVQMITKKESQAADALMGFTENGKDKVSQTNNLINQVAEKTGSISKMIDLITDIASRINLLAINAAIEASHAGESGKGFAVVAKEVGNLATTTSRNVDEISSSLLSISEDMENAKQVSVASGLAFQDILENVQNMVNAMAEINATMEELAVGEQDILHSSAVLLEKSQNIQKSTQDIFAESVSINEGMESIQEQSKSTRADMHDVTKATENLNQAMMAVTAGIQQNLVSIQSLSNSLQDFAPTGEELVSAEEPTIGLSWSSRFSVGLDAMDSQHKVLVESLDGFLKAMHDGTALTQLDSMLTTLGKYVVDHFNDEEVLMEKHGYPDLENHKKIHRDFIEQLGQLKSDFDTNGATPQLAARVQDSVADWLIYHITQTDADYGKYINAHE
jgi:hemerythrin-like metal-binding protein